MIRTRMFRTLSLLIAVPACAIISSAPPAAAADLAVVSGTGTITPGLPCFRCSINFAFTSVKSGTSGHSGIYSGCWFNGTSAGIEDEFGGSGSGTVGGCGFSGNIAYSRVGVVVTISGTICYSDGYCSNIGASALPFVPLSAAPTTNFVVTGIIEHG
jgi:hypothetical protein